ncbi:MAG TPA: carboxypeptidase-like regulatory domain-containing protein [Vicinamibacterales bacterium]|nr:carboxypeptidase-like regulatory domain-containing protein [Vicinamibacterales bacterium]
MKPLAGAIGLFGLLAVPLLGQVYVPPGGVMPVKGANPVRMTTVPYTGPAVVIGQIVDAATGRGISHAIVHLEGQGTEITRVADTSGRFYVTGLGGGDYSINATKSGYFDGAYGQRRVGGDALPLSMLEHQWVSDLKIALWRPAVIGGQITDEAGEPLIGVRVEALRKQYHGGALQLVPWMTAVTNDQGDYRLAKLQPGDYVISVPSTVGSVPDLNAIRIVTGPPDAPVPDNDALLTFQDVLSQAQNIRTDASGAYTLVRGPQNPPPPLGTSRPETYATTYFGGSFVSSGALTLTVGPGETRLGASVQLHPVPLGAISGIVTGPAGPLQNQALRLMAAGESDLGFGRETAITRTNEDGTFAFPEVPQGDYVIEASTNASFRLGIVTGDGDEPGNRKVTGLFASVQAAEESDRPALWGRARVTLADRDVTDVKIDMEPAITVSGHVIFEGSAKLPEKIGEHFWLEATPVGGPADPSHHAKIDDDGAFVIRGLARGEYFLRPSSPPPGWYIRAVMSAGHDLLSSPLDLSTIGDVDDLEVIYTDKPTEIGGVVYSGLRSPVAGATIVIFPAEPSYRGTAGQHPDRVRTIRATNTGGFHVVALPAGDYYIAAIDEAAADAWQDPRRLDVIRAGAKRMTIKPGDHVPIDLQLITRR